MKNWPALFVRFTPATATDEPVIRDLVAAALDDLRPTAVQESDTEWMVFFGSAADRDLAASTLPIAAPGGVEVGPVDVPDEDWAARSQQDLQPVHVGRITIAAPWHVASAEATAPKAAGAARITIVVQPSMGFGTGHHASTRLCTALLQNIDLVGKSVIDAGTGSGVLALAARALGARSVVAVDDDADAIGAARENLQLNRVGEGIDLQVGDLRTLPLEPADVVTANLTGGLLIRAATHLARAVAPRGSLIISGVMLEEEPDVLAAFSGLTVAERLSEDEWVGMRLARRPAAALPAPPCIGRGPAL